MPAMTLSILCVHGVGHGDADASLAPLWTKAISTNLRRWNPTLQLDFEFLQYDDLFDHAPLDGTVYAAALARLLASGLVRGLVDWRRRRHADCAHLSEEEHIAEGDKSPGVLMASGYIAGGAIAGMLIAIMAGVPMFSGYNDRLEKWTEKVNPFAAQITPTQISPDLLSLIPFAVLVGILYLTGRGAILRGKTGG